MGLLRPGARYIYERSDGVVYAREFGADPSTRFEVGRYVDPENKFNSKLEELTENKLWADIRKAARTNPALQAELERVIMLYHLIKTNE